MFKLQELNKGEGYNIVTFTDDQEAYGSLVILEEEGLYIEFMEFDGEDLLIITEDGSPDEYSRLEEKYLDDILNALEE